VHDDIHDCATFLWSQRQQPGDTVTCRCNRMWTLGSLTRWRLLLWGTYHDAPDGQSLWVRDRRAERAVRRVRILRTREARR